MSIHVVLDVRMMSLRSANMSCVVVNAFLTVTALCIIHNLKCMYLFNVNVEKQETDDGMKPDTID